VSGRAQGANPDLRDVLPELTEEMRSARFILFGLAKALYHGIRSGLAMSRSLPRLRASFMRSMIVLAAVLAAQGVVVARFSVSPSIGLPLALLPSWYVLGGFVAYSQLAMVRTRDGALRDKFGVANTLTLYRFLSIPFLVLLIPYFPGDMPVLKIGLGIFAMVAVSDAADGMIARLTGKVTDFGRIYDPVCDIAMNAGVCIGAYLAGYLPLWYTLVAEARFLLPLLGGAWVYVHRKPYRVRPTLWGKATVFVYAVFIGMLFLKQIVHHDFLDAAADRLLWVSGALLAWNVIVLVDLGRSLARRNDGAAESGTANKRVARW